MITTNYSVKPCYEKGMNYTMSNGSHWYQNNLEFRERILYKMTETLVPIYKRLFKPKVSKWDITIEKLAQYKEGTLGKAWFNFYENQNFGISSNYEEHDICHTLLGYNTSIVEETRMYCFLLGSGKISAPTLFTIIIGCLALPEFIQEFYADYLLGKKAVNFSNWDFTYLLHEPIEILHKMIFRLSKEGNPVIF